ncbi:MAG TPA: DHHA1 domain-containing protein [Nitrososphaerales archaeon]|nr:DHHA1 domain-containing protein [Nitrososphaerales archaeon]
MKAFCISHIKDVDGLSSAALVLAATGADLLLTNYNGILADLDKVPEDAEKVIICDIGSDVSESEEFVEKLGKIASRSKVTYIDHHFATGATKRKISRKGVNLVHDVNECASILTYLTFRKSLPEEAKKVALYGAVTDYMDDAVEAKRLMEQTDRHFILLEASMLAYALAKRGDELGFPYMVAKELAQMKHPHEIAGVPALAVEHLDDVVKLEVEVRKTGKTIGHVAYVETDQQATGGVAKLLIGAFGVPVGVAYKEKDKGWCEVSLRCTSECTAHLGKTISPIAAKLGGTGGGHKRAAGCRVATDKIQEMLRMLSTKV